MSDELGFMPTGVAVTPMASTSKPALLNLQNGMPVITQSRSRELAYDALGGNPRFISNPYGPQWLVASRTTHRWN
jgi:hypothetical protein